jgi:hypothetical protein
LSVAETDIGNVTGPFAVEGLVATSPLLAKVTAIELAAESTAVTRPVIPMHLPFCGVVDWVGMAKAVRSKVGLMCCMRFDYGQFVEFPMRIDSISVTNKAGKTTTNIQHPDQC